MECAANVRCLLPRSLDRMQSDDGRRSDGRMGMGIPDPREDATPTLTPKGCGTNNARNNKLQA